MRVPQGMDVDVVCGWRRRKEGVTSSDRGGGRRCNGMKAAPPAEALVKGWADSGATAEQQQRRQHQRRWLRQQEKEELDGLCEKWHCFRISVTVRLYNP